jgi:hypothetical protein
MAQYRAMQTLFWGIASRPLSAADATWFEHETPPKPD